MESQPAELLVACLCAAWCHVCNDYRRAFDTLARESRTNTRWRWIDIEDDEDLLGGVEVDDFPTLLVAAGGQVRFFGVIAPNAKATHLALTRAQGRDARCPVDEARLHALASRLDT